MIKKSLGYVLSIIGLIGLASSLFPEVKVQFPPLVQIDNLSLTAAGIILILIGIFIVMKTSSKRGLKIPREVPIYRGNKIVGYRRHY